MIMVNNHKLFFSLIRNYRNIKKKKLENTSSKSWMHCMKMRNTIFVNLLLWCNSPYFFLNSSHGKLGLRKVYVKKIIKSRKKHFLLKKIEIVLLYEQWSNRLYSSRLLIWPGGGQSLNWSVDRAFFSYQ